MRHVVFTPPPTPNGGLHVGHVAGPYLRADLNVRLLRLLGGTAVHATHVDTYQTYVAKKAAEEGRDVDEFRREMADLIAADYRSFGIGIDSRIDNTTEPYVRYLRGCLDELLEDRRAVARDEVLTADGRSAVEAFVSGLCPDCLQQAAANVCENCGRPLSVPQMLAPRAEPAGPDVFGTAAADRTTLPTVLAVDEDDLAELRAVHRTIARDDVFVGELVAGLAPHDVTLTFRSDYGFAVGPGRVLNPWVEIFFAHVYAIGQILGLAPECSLDDVRAAVRNAPDLQVSYYFGVDNTYYYAALFPVLARMLELPGVQPRALKANRFLRLDGRKVSSSKNNAVWAADIASAAPVRAARSALAGICPEFAEREYTGLPHRDAGEPVDAGALAAPVTGPGRILARSLERLSDPAEFTVRDVLNRLARAREAVDSHRLTPDEESELAGLVRAVEHGLCI